MLKIGGERFPRCPWAALLSTLTKTETVDNISKDVQCDAGSSRCREYVWKRRGWMELRLKREGGRRVVCVCLCVKRGKLKAGGWQTKVREGREEWEGGGGGGGAKADSREGKLRREQWSEVRRERRRGQENKWTSIWKSSCRDMRSWCTAHAPAENWSVVEKR